MSQSQHDLFDDMRGLTRRGFSAVAPKVEEAGGNVAPQADNFEDHVRDDLRDLNRRGGGTKITPEK